MTRLTSIIIPCYNAEKWIRECIDSALSQTYSPIEVIVVDDGSTDNSVAVIKEYGDKIRWISCENGGPSAARNRGIQLSKGEYIQFVDADDYISLDKVKQAVECLELFNTDIVYGDWCNQYHKVDGTTELSDYKINQPTDDIIYYTIAYNKIHVGSCLFKHEVFEKVSEFNESLRIAEDYDFFVRLALAGATFTYQAGCHYFYRIYGAVTASHGQGIDHPKAVELALNSMSLVLGEKGLSTDKYRHALACNYFSVARSYLMVRAISAADRCYEKCTKLSGTRKFKSDGNSNFEKVYNLFGWVIAARLISSFNSLQTTFKRLKIHL